MTRQDVETDIDTVDFFTDNTLLHDPYEYLAAMREQCPVRKEPHYLPTFILRGLTRLYVEFS